jgi:hypothetical protein
VHKVCLLFGCTLRLDSDPRLPDVPDPNQVGVAWVALAEIESVRLLPEPTPQMRDALRHVNRGITCHTVV